MDQNFDALFSCRESEDLIDIHLLGKQKELLKFFNCLVIRIFSRNSTIESKLMWHSVIGWQNINFINYEIHYPINECCIIVGTRLLRS